uniref:Uncharacterized protein n=1 Tax=Panagrolaimus sp. ES5 TaxID=591445 RepID=A0AC34GKT3_9BILA
MFADTVLYLAMVMRALHYSLPEKRLLSKRVYQSRHQRSHLRNDVDYKTEIAHYHHSYLNKILSTRAYVCKIFKSLDIQDYNFNAGDIAFMNAVTYCGCEI